jgi:hypothetical protein
VAQAAVEEFQVHLATLVVLQPRLIQINEAQNDLESRADEI